MKFKSYWRSLPLLTERERSELGRWLVGDWQRRLSERQVDYILSCVKAGRSPDSCRLR